MDEKDMSSVEQRDEQSPENELKESMVSGKKHIIREEMMSLIMKGSLPGPDISDKLTPEHIDKMLDIEIKQLENKSKDNHEKRNQITLFTTLGLVVFIVIALLFKSTPDLLERILTLFVGLVGGFGIGKATNNKSDD